MLFSIIIEPIEMIVSWVFLFFLNKFPFMGCLGAIFGVSLVINFLALPLYNVADRLQEKERLISKKLEYRVKRIKKGFKGDEQFMMLSEYYRQNDYHPLYVLRSSLSILIEIPFFIAAYQYLSHLEVLKSDSFWFLTSFGEPDRLFTFPLWGLTITINILPIIMTVINFISGYIYTKESTLRDKIQLYVMGLFFLIILYNSPSGLVLYWILNNIFSLCKTIALKTKYPRQILLWSLGLSFIIFGVIYAARVTIFNKLVFIFLTVGVLLICYSFINKKFNIIINIKQNHIGLIVISGLCLAILCGIIIPSSVIATSPIEFSNIGNTESPLSYIWHAFFVFIGLFLFWPLCISKMFGKKVSVVTGLVLICTLFMALINTFIFSGNFGNLTVQFFLENPKNLEQISLIEKIIPILILVAIITIIILIELKKKVSLLILLCISICIGEFIFGVVKINDIKKYLSDNYQSVASKKLVYNQDILPVFKLSKNGQNVVILFLDRAVNQFFPYAIEELPELKNQFSGFKYYPNTLSFANSTVSGAPAMMGGYEYTPKKIDERYDELLVDKHNESMLVLPTIFEKSGYGISITDPPYSNYVWSGDLTPFNILSDAYIDELTGRYSRNYLLDKRMNINFSHDKNIKKESVNYSIMQIIPPIVRKSFNDNCRNYETINYENFIDQFSVLYYLPNLFNIDNYDNQYLFISNSTTHEPEYMDCSFEYPVSKDEGCLLKWIPSDDYTLIHYETFIATFKQIGKWLDYLRTENVYDNTKIIIVSDHGRNVNISSFFDEEKLWYTPILLFKDFNQNTELSIDDTFMTNADVPLLAMKDLEVSNVNPFTGNELSADKENGIDVISTEWDGEIMKKQRKTQFGKGFYTNWHINPGDISKEENWIRLESR